MCQTQPDKTLPVLDHKIDRHEAMELVRTYEVGGMSRRQFLNRATATLGSLALANLVLAACSPIAPNLPQSGMSSSPEGVGAAGSSAMSAGGLITGDVEYPDTDGETLTGYLARPEGDGQYPALIVLQEWWGLNEHIKDVANRFAQQGFVVLAPDLYKGEVATEPDEARKLVMALDQPNAVLEIGQAIEFLLAHEAVSSDTAGIVGYCMGGGLVLRTAISDAKVGAAVAYYGSPLSADEAAMAKAPVLGLFGAEDGGIPVDAVNAMGEALTAAGVTNEIHIYDGAGHAFFNDTRESAYNEAAATDAWTRTLAWFNEYL